jgi:predicted RNA-binding protein (virulence factor B family)
MPVARIVDFGVYLSDDDGEEVLLPNRYVPEGIVAGDYLKAFIYRDSEGRLTATTELPKIELDGIACLEVVSTSPAGAFLDWGLAKDLFVPKRGQPERFREGEWHIVKVCLDERTDRLFGTADLKNHVCRLSEGYETGEEVDLIIADQTDLGYNAIVDEGCWGLLYAEEIFTDLEYGQRLTGYVKLQRPDGKLDLALQPPGYARVAAIEDQLLDAIKADDGVLNLTTKSPPEAIHQRFGISKKAFKLAVSALYKKRLIRLKPDGLYLREPAEEEE